MSAFPRVSRYCPALKTHLIAVLVLLAFFSARGLARDAREQQRIDFLIQKVESSKGLVFIRNGAEYEGGAAGRHLRMKLDYGGERVKTAEDFVRYCASESSVTHRRYMVRQANGATTDSAAYFVTLLR